MFLRFKELYYIDGTATILLEIDKDSDNLKDININYAIELDDVYIINLEYECFDNKSISNLIDKILIKYNMDFIDKNLWNKYLEDTEREKKDKCIPFNIISKPKFNIALNAKEKELCKYQFNFSTDYKQIWYDSESLNNCIKIKFYEEKIYDDEDYAITLLNIIFNSSFNLKIKKCKICKKPFLTKTLNLLNCKRPFKDGISCNQYDSKIRKQHQYEDSIKHLQKNVRDKLKNDEDRLNEFNKLLPKKKIEYFNDNKSFVLWLLTYYTKEGKENAIKRLGLAKYL